MMRQYELVERVKQYNPNADEDLLNRAYVYAMLAHGSQKRASGEAYFTHPLEVAAILTDLRLDDATIVAAVLHDTVEDTTATVEDINDKFGPAIGALVDGLTKLKKLDFVSTKAKQGENFRKLLLAVTQDVRVLLVKLADRLHNMRTLDHMRDDKRKRIAEETLEIYAPLAGRMGMQEIREELEELAFRHIKPEAHELITRKVALLRERSGRLIREIEDVLSARLKERGIAAQVKGRAKRPYSIWRKMERKSISFEQLSDILGFRILVPSLEDCYRVLGVVHTTWPMVPGRYKDYISTPKSNDYRSLHTTVIGPGPQRIELQIRTEDMDRVAEYGVAAHAIYKDGRTGGTRDLSESSAYQWLRKTVDTLADGASPEEFLEHTKLEMFHDQVFCFSPKGLLIALPRGASAIDFAYAVHTDVGNSAVGCKINGRNAPLLTALQNGDEVEIVRAEGQTPPAAWESLVVTGKARAAIRRATRAAVRRQYAGLGRQILDRAFERAGRPLSDDKLKAALARLARSSTEDVLAAVGRGEMYSGDVLRAVYPDLEVDKRPAVELTPGETARAGRGKGDRPQGEERGGIPITGLNGDVAVQFAPGSGAVPGDRIVGIMNPGVGVTIYPIQSPALAAFDDDTDRWIDVRWDPESARNRRFPARIALTSINEPGTLAQISQVIAEHDGNIDAVTMARQSPDFTNMTIDVSVWDLKHLNAIIGELRQKRVISDIERLLG